MIVYAVYVITQDGKTILSENFQSTKEVPDDMLLGGLITALQALATEVTETRSEMKSIEVEGLSYHIRSFGLYRIVLVTDVPKFPDDIIQTMGLRFMKEYGETLLDDLYSKKTFAPFKETIAEIIGAEMVTDDSKSIKPAKMLSTGEIFSLPHQLHPTALALVSLEEGTVEEIAQESDLSPEETRENLIVLKEMGFIGVKQKKDKTTYFCSPIK
ncbi:MAG: hypothetical protein ACFFCQ_16275 [Promethearchaeota archaeon]